MARVDDAADPEPVILFGGRGDAEADPDVDPVVVEAEPFGTGPRCRRNTPPEGKGQHGRG